MNWEWPGYEVIISFDRHSASQRMHEKKKSFILKAGSSLGTRLRIISVYAHIIKACYSYAQRGLHLLFSLLLVTCKA